MATLETILRVFPGSKRLIKGFSKDSQRTALLLHCAGQDVQDIFDTLCNVVTQFGDELYQCKDPDVRARGQRVKVLEFVNLEINNVSINS